MHALALLPALLLAAPTVEGVRADLVEGRLDLEVTASETLYREDVRAKLDGKILALYIQGGEVRSKRTFAAGAMTVTALPRSNYAKLEIPLQPELGCTGPVTLTVEDAVLKASLRCTPVAAAWAPAPRAAPADKPAAAKVAPVEKPAAEKTAPAEKAVPVAAPAAKPAASEKSAVVVTDRATAPAPPEKAAAEAQADKPGVIPADKPFAGAKPSTRTAAPVAAPAPAKDNSPSPFTMVVFVALAGLAGYLLWRKRKQQQSGMIKILETASIGAKRSIVIAEVNGQRMILGTSEAGINVLSDHAGLTNAAASPTMAQAAAGVAAGPAPAAAPEAAPHHVTDGESNVLARLFQRRKKEETVEEEETGPSTMAEDFRDLLEDSLEDEELRRRLATGSSGRTS